MKAYLVNDQLGRRLEILPAASFETSDHKRVVFDLNADKCSDDAADFCIKTMPEQYRVEVIEDE